MSKKCPEPCGSCREADSFNGVFKELICKSPARQAAQRRSPLAYRVPTGAECPQKKPKHDHAQP